MIKGRDQTFARDSNMKAIFSLLAGDNMSCTELAKVTGLSKPALTKITQEMFAMGLITVDDHPNPKKDNELGRKPVYYTINPDYGLVAAVDFSTVNITVRLSNLAGKFVDEEVLLDSEYITFQVLDKVIAVLTRLRNLHERKNRTLYTVCIAASGMITRDGAVVQSPKFTECTGMNLKEFFTERLSCDAIVNNDINLSLLGEKSNALSAFSNAVMLYIDSGIGGAVSINNKIIEGDNGFAGEFGLTMMYDNGEYMELDKISSINAIKNEIKKRINAGAACSLSERFRFIDVVEAYRNCDKTVVEVVSESAKFVALFIRNAVAFLDSRLFLISGRINQLGESYLESIRSFIPAAVHAEIAFNPLGRESILLGATTLAIESSINKIIESR